MKILVVNCLWNSGISVSSKFQLLEKRSCTIDEKIVLHLSLPFMLDYGVCFCFSLILEALHCPEILSFVHTQVIDLC